MLFIISILFIFLIFFTYTRKLDHTSKWFILSFQILWMLILCFSTTRPYGLYLPSDYTYYLLLINVFSFSIGFILNGRKKFIQPDLSLAEYDVVKILDKNIIKICIIVGCIISIYYFTIFLAAASLSSSLGDVRMDFYSGELYGPFYDTINGLFLNPLQIISYPLAAFAVYKKKWIAIPLLVFLVCYNSLAGGRIGYVKVFYSFIFAIICIKTLTFKRFSGLLIGACILFIGISYVTAERGKTSDNVSEQIEDGMDETLEHIATYTCGATVAFDYALEDNYLEQVGGYSYGGLTATSLLHLTYIVSNKLGFPFEQPIIRLAPIKQDKWIKVSQSRSFNALYTAVLFFYLDFGIAGVIFIPFLLGLLVRFIINQFLKYPNIWMLTIVNYIFILTLTSTTDFSLRDFSSLVVLVILYIIGTKHRKRQHLIINY